MDQIIDIIKDYQQGAGRAVSIFKIRYSVNDILKGWRSGLYEQTGRLEEEGLLFYAFHGIGLAAHFKDKVVDFDFAYFPEPRHDGFDLWRISEFIENHISKYPNYKNKKRIEEDFNNLIRKGIIAKPKLNDSTNPYFFKDTLNTSIENET